MFYCDICDIFKNIFFAEHIQETTSENFLELRVKTKHIHELNKDSLYFMIALFSQSKHLN